MKYFKKIIYISLSIIFLIACQTSNMQRTRAPQYKSPPGLPENLWVSKDFNKQLDSILSYYKQAGQKLAEGDTIGAEIYFDQSFEIVAQFSDEDRAALQKWVDYDSVFRKMNHEYEEIYQNSTVTLEAEEVREAITDYEEISLSDSALNGNGVLVDSSGDVPITLNKKVRLALKYFQTKGRYVFSKWLQRSGKYLPMVQKIFEEYNLPPELAYVAMIESGFNPKARSYARAVGMWQFISATGRYYGLRHNWWFDERRDVIKSTHAAAQHLGHLYERFGDWYLAMSGYNCNPRKVEYNMRRYKTRDFWKLKRLPRQTRNYVPTFLAAVIIAREPEKFGFFVDKVRPVQMDTVKISESVDLNVVANLVDTSYAYIKEINPAVLRWVTPPGIKDFTLYLPAGSKEKFKQGYAKIPDKKKRSWVRHRIRSGETLSTIARKYHTSMSVLRSINKLRGSFIRAGKYLLIPVPQNKAQYYAYNARRSVKSKRRSHSGAVVKNVAGHKKVTYLVKAGDTLGEIAENFHTRASKIRAWNGLSYGQYIKPKQKLNIWIPENAGDVKNKLSKSKKTKEEPGVYYTVKTGDTLWDIAKKYGVTIRELRKLNKMRGSRIRPGDRLRVAKN